MVMRLVIIKNDVMELEILALLHAKYELLHPFQYFNGPVSFYGWDAQN